MAGPQGPRGQHGIVKIPPKSLTKADRGPPGDVGKHG